MNGEAIKLLKDFGDPKKWELLGGHYYRCRGKSNVNTNKWPHEIVQEAIALLEAEADPGEFTKRLRLNVTERKNFTDKLFGAMLKDDILEACDRIDSLTAELAETRKKPAPTESMPRGVLCVYCGRSVVYGNDLTSKEMAYEKMKEHDKLCPDNPLVLDNARLTALLSEIVSANPECCWRKCWDCGKKQIHSSDVTPGVLCRFCGSQDTRLMKKETQALKGE